jgi:hypothetical protein
MKLIISTLVLASISGSSQSAPITSPPSLDFERAIYGAPVPKHVPEWTRIRIEGPPMTVMRPIIWISSQVFEREYPEQLIRLSPGEYKTFSSLVQKQRCLGLFRGDRRSPEIVEVTSKAAGFSEAHCAMSRTVACSYLSSIATQKLRWADTRWEPIRSFRAMRYLKC